MTDAETRLREALTPTPDDHDRARRLVDATIQPSAHRVTPATWRHRRPWVAVSGAAVAAVLAVGVLALPRFGSGQDEAATTPAVVSSATPMPTMLTVTCGLEGPRLDTDRVAARPEGIRVRFVNATRQAVTPRAVSDPNIDVPERGSSPLDAGQGQTVTLQDPPGRLTVMCDALGRGPSRTLTVFDPQHAWLGTASEAGCGLGGLGSYAYGPGEGATPEAAARAWSEAAPAPHAPPPGLSVRRLSMGYRAAPAEWWVVEHQGRPTTLLTVVRTIEGEWAANPTWICKGALP